MSESAAWRSLLGNVYYGVTVTAIFLSLVGWMFKQAARIDTIEEHDAEHPTKTELREVAIKVENRIDNLERQIEELNLRGSRVLNERTTRMSNQLEEIDRRILVLEAVAKEGIPAIVRQAETIRRLEELERAFRNFTYPRGPTGPTDYPSKLQ